MHFYKLRKDLIQRVCFTPKEFLELVLSKKTIHILKLHLQKHSNIEEQVKEDASKTANSRDYEYYVAFFDLFELFEEDCNFCFNLKSSFNKSKDKIITLEALRKYTDDPPDIIVEKEGAYYEFELKRYRDALDTKDFENFVHEKLLKKYLAKRNYLVLIQSESDNEIDPIVFENVHQSIKESGKDLGRIAFSFNAMNEKQIIVTVWPELHQQSRPFTTGSEAANKILSK